MNKLRIILLGTLMLFNNCLFSQVRQYTFKIEVLQDGNSTITAAYIEMLIDGARQKANQDGMIRFTAAMDRKAVEVSMPDQREYVIIGATHIGLPENPDVSITITIRKPNQKEQALIQVNKGLKKLDIEIDQLDSIRRNNYDQYAGLKRSVDSIISSVTQKFHIPEADLRSATDKMAGRDKYFSAIAASLEAYLNEAKDVRDQFKNKLVYALDQPKYFKFSFDSTIRVYNNVYNALNDNNNEYEKAVEEYWESDDLAVGFHNVFDFAINDIHRAQILPLNIQLIQKANEYIHEKSKSKRKALKSDIISTLNGITPFLDNNLTILENKVRYYIGKLESLKDTYKL